jgi:hypothetical protein
MRIMAASCCGRGSPSPYDRTGHDYRERVLETLLAPGPVFGEQSTFAEN